MRPENWRKLGFGNAYWRVMKRAMGVRQCRVMSQNQQPPQVRICIDGIVWTESATRVVYAHHHGIDSLSDELHVRRTCLNLSCIAPDHLALFPPSTMISEEQRRRRRVSSRAAASKGKRLLPHQTVTAILKRAKAGKGMADLVERYGQMVYRVANGFSYRRDDKPIPERGTVGQYLRPPTPGSTRYKAAQ